MKKTKITAVLLSTLLLSTYAQSADFTGFYLGAGAGNTNLDDDGLFIDADGDGTTFKAIAGYQFNRIASAEVQYTRYGDVVAKGTNNTRYTWEPKAISLSANVGYTFDNGLRPFGIAGLSSMDLNQSMPLLDDDKGSAVHYGLGIEYSPAQLSGLRLRAAYEADLFIVDLAAVNKDYDVVVNSFYLSAAYLF